MHRKSEVDYISYFCTVQMYMLERISVPSADNNTYTDFKEAKGILSLTLIEHQSRVSTVLFLLSSFEH